MKANIAVVGALATLACLATTVDALAKQPKSPSACVLTDVSPNVVACEGWYSGNLLKPPDLAVDATHLNTLLGTNAYTASNVSPIATLSDLKAGKDGLTTIDFGQTLYGETIIAFHNGAATGVKGDLTTGEEPGLGAQGTGFFLLDLQNAVQSVTLNVPGSSGAWLFSTQQAPAVPEPAAWALVLVGVTAVGGGLRRSRRNESGASVSGRDRYPATT